MGNKSGDGAIVLASAAGFYDFSEGDFTPLKLVSTRATQVFCETTRLILQLEEKNTENAAGAEPVLSSSGPGGMETAGGKQGLGP